MSDFLQITNLSIGYNHALVNAISTTGKLGEIILLMGNNGVGKTTLMKSLLGQIKTLKGNITIQSKPIENYSQQEIAEQIAVVFSKAEVPDHYSVEDLIRFGKYIHYPYYFKINAEDQEEIETIIKGLKLETYRHTQLQHLSDGNLQKAFIGRALAQNSPIILLDEPTTHLDEDNKLIILNLLRQLALKQNKLILFSSHDWRLAKEFSDKIWWIHDKTLTAEITEELFLNHPQLLHAYIFEINTAFRAPKITAKQSEKELLFSFLQKNFNQDLSSFSITYKDKTWKIEYESYTSYHKSLLEIKNSLQSLLNT